MRPADLLHNHDEKPPQNQERECQEAPNHSEHTMGDPAGTCPQHDMAEGQAFNSEVNLVVKGHQNVLLQLGTVRQVQYWVCTQKVQ